MTARKRSIHVVDAQVRRAGTLRFCQKPAHDAPTDYKIHAESRNAGSAARGIWIILRQALSADIDAVIVRMARASSAPLTGKGEWIDWRERIHFVPGDETGPTIGIAAVMAPL